LNFENNGVLANRLFSSVDSQGDIQIVVNSLFFGELVCLGCLEEELIFKEKKDALEDQED